jgi:hypothetical protein
VLSALVAGSVRKPLVAQGGTDRRRHLLKVIVVTVRVARPGKIAAEETILMATRHDMDMEVRHALADHIVDRHERTVATGGLRHGAGQASREGEEGTHFGHGQIGKGRDVLPRHEQNVAGQERASIEEGDARWIVEDDLGRRIAADDSAEDARATARPIGRIERDVEDHGDRAPLSRE